MKSLALIVAGLIGISISLESQASVNSEIRDEVRNTMLDEYSYDDESWLPMEPNGIRGIREDFRFELDLDCDFVMTGFSKRTKITGESKVEHFWVCVSETEDGLEGDLIAFHDEFSH